jgi:hypothetical protein
MKTTTRVLSIGALLVAAGGVLPAQNYGALPDNCEVPSRSFPTALRYYGTFHPADSILDFFCKVQTLKGTGVLKVEFNDEVTSIAGTFSGSFQHRFTFDGTPKMTKRDIGKLLTEAMQGHLSTGRGRSNVRPLS